MNFDQAIEAIMGLHHVLRSAPKREREFNWNFIKGKLVAAYNAGVEYGSKISAAATPEVDKMEAVP